VFSPREKKILEDLVFMFKDVKAWEISEISHLANQPWDATKRERGENTLIEVKATISSDCLAQLKNCLKKFKDDISERHWRMIFKS